MHWRFITAKWSCISLQYVDFPLPAGPTTNCAYRGILKKSSVIWGHGLDRKRSLCWYTEFDFIWLWLPWNRFVSRSIILFHCKLPFFVLKHNSRIAFQIFEKMKNVNANRNVSYDMFDKTRLLETKFRHEKSTLNCGLDLVSRNRPRSGVGRRMSYEMNHINLGPNPYEVYLKMAQKYCDRDRIRWLDMHSNFKMANILFFFVLGHFEN